MDDVASSYFAVSTEFNIKDASDWVLNNVINHLPERHFNGSNAAQACLWKNNEEIRNNLFQFITRPADGEVEFYGYYSDYDWVLFCSLFGTMLDLPRGFPMYCIDLKQMLDDKIKRMTESEFGRLTGISPHQKLFVPFKEKLEVIKKLPGYPVNKNEHNALADAKWNRALYNFINTI